jgi:SPX domain protein involved in polyphosphate accumulation
MNEIVRDDYRCERKFQIDALDPLQVINLVKLHPSVFVVPFPPRYINNIYLDTKDMTYYHENVIGSKDRRKARIRWYSDLFGDINKPILEYKIKDGFVGTKEYHDFPPFLLDESFDIRYFWEKLDSVSAEVRYYIRELDPVLINRYLRNYYVTRDGKFRLTIDRGLSYYNIRPHSNNFKQRFLDHQNIIVEIKYDKELDDKAGRVAGYFPFTLTKSSKYVQGIDSVYI